MLQSHEQFTVCSVAVNVPQFGQPLTCTVYVPVSNGAEYVLLVELWTTTLFGSINVYVAPAQAVPEITACNWLQNNVSFKLTVLLHGCVQFKLIELDVSPHPFEQLTCKLYTPLVLFGL